jgi:lysophospholipase L1-like esterase
VRRLQVVLVALGVVGALLLGLTEVALRVASASNPALARTMRSYDPLAVQIVPIGRLGYRQRPGTSLTYINGATATANSLGYRGPEVSLEKPAGTVRIILLGGSTTHGWGVEDTATIDAHMREILASRYPGMRFEVLNLALDGFDSNALVERLRAEGVGYRPDIVIVNTGINDVRNVRIPNLQDPDERMLIWESVLRRLRAEREAGGPSLWSRTKHTLMIARLPGLLRDATTNRQIQVARPTEKVHPEGIEIFTRNLHRMAAIADSAGAVLLLSTPPSSLRTKYKPDDVSRISYWVINAETTQQVRDTLSARLRGVADSIRVAGGRVGHVPHSLSDDLFFDDCHLTSRGNRQMAEDFATAIAAWLPKAP